MAKKLLFFTLFFSFFLTTNGQIISGQIINKNSLKPIENVAIITNLKTGTTSNYLGKYTINLNNVKSITFSSLGFKPKVISKSELQKLNYNLSLVEHVNQLKEIQLNIAKISLDSLLIKTYKTMKANYLSDAVKQEIYVVDTQKMDFKKLDLEIKSSSILSRQNKKLAEKELKEFSDNIQQKKPEFNSEFKGTILTKEFFSKKAKRKFNLYNIDSVQGFRKVAIGNGVTVKNVTDKLQNIILKHLDSNKTYKIKSGFFKVEDSLSLKEVTRINDSIEKENSFGNYKISNYSRSSKNIGDFFKDDSENNFLNRKYYDHHLEKNEVLGVQKYYQISFQPRKSKSKYSGTMFIDPSDFSIKKISYKFADGKRGDHLNLKFLLGVKFSENIHNTTLFYEKTKENKIYTSYFNETRSSYAYINRPIKFIENTKDKNKVKFNIKVEINVTESMEVLLKNVAEIDKNSVVALQKGDYKKKTVFMTPKNYNNVNWKNRLFMKTYLEEYL